MKKKILVTGGAGFLGVNLVKKLLNEENLVTVIDNFCTGNIENLKPFYNNSNFKYLYMDITSDKFAKYLKKHYFNQIYNLACPASPKYYFDHPIETWEASVIGVRNIINGIKGKNTIFLQTSTSEIYGDSLVSPQSEKYWGNVNCFGRRSCYDEGKRAAETLIYDSINTWNMDIRIVRIFNTYGPGMYIKDGRVISNFFSQAIMNENITIYGDGYQTRSFCYVDDTIKAIYMVMNSDKSLNFPVNIGNPVEITINEVADMILKITHSSAKIIHLERTYDDPKKRKPDINLVNLLLGWKPKIALDDGLERCYPYFKTECGKEGER